MLPNGPEFVASYLGVLSLGAVAVCINPMLAEVETAFILADSACRLALAQGDVAARLSLNGLPVLDAGIGPRAGSVGVGGGSRMIILPSSSIPPAPRAAPRG